MLDDSEREEVKDILRSMLRGYSEEDTIYDKPRNIVLKINIGEKSIMTNSDGYI